MKSHTNNTMSQIFFIHSISILLTFLAVFCVGVAFTEEVVSTISGGNLPVTDVGSPMEFNLFNNNIYITNNGSNIVINNAINTSVVEVPFESEFNPSDNKKYIMNPSDENSIPDTRIDSGIKENSKNITEEEGIDTIIESAKDGDEKLKNGKITPTTKEFNIAISGDWGCETDTKETVKNIQDKNPELVIAAGDLSYEKSTAVCWIQEIIKPVITKTKIAFGDHDYIGKGEDRKPKQDYLAHFNLSQTYYSFNRENVHFLVMDPNAENGINSNQFKFVQDDLHSASLNQSINWIFVVEHDPIYTSPSQHAADSTIRDIYHPLFDKYGVDLVISGDNHNYQRTFPLKYNEHKPSEPLITDTDKTHYDDLKGQIYLIVGVGGRSLYNIIQQAPFVATQNDKYFGYLDINIKGNNLEGSFYSNQVSVNEGRNNYIIIDKFSISKDN